MIDYLDLDDLLALADRILDEVLVRDAGLLESALVRPRSAPLGQDAYPMIEGKSAALLHSLATNHGFVDGNKRVAIASVMLFLGLNGYRLDATEDDLFDLTLDVAGGDEREVDKIAARLRPWILPVA